VTGDGKALLGGGVEEGKKDRGWREKSGKRKSKMGKDSGMGDGRSRSRE